MRLIAFLFLLSFSFSVFSSPECAYWRKRTQELEKRIVKHKNDLTSCRRDQIPTCSDLELLIESLEFEKEDLNDKLRYFCHNLEK